MPVNNYAIFAIGLFVGTFLGFLILGLLTAPRMAELEATVAGLRELLNAPDVSLVRNVRAMDREVEG